MHWSREGLGLCGIWLDKSGPLFWEVIGKVWGNLRKDQGIGLGKCKNVWGMSEED